MDGPMLFLGDSRELGRSKLSVYDRRLFVINYKTSGGNYIDVVIFNMRKSVPLSLYKTISDDLANGFGVRFISGGVNIAEFRDAAHSYLKNINDKVCS
jgi:acetoacetate decarboxylase